VLLLVILCHNCSIFKMFEDATLVTVIPILAILAVVLSHLQ